MVSQEAQLKLVQVLDWNIILMDRIQEINAKEIWSLKDNFHYLVNF